MLERAKILEAWAQRSGATADTNRKRKAESFFDYVRSNPGACYDDLAAEFRRNYYDAFEEIVPVVLAIDDPLLIYHVVQRADLNNPREAAVVESLIGRLDSTRHQVTFRALARSGTPEIRATMLAKPNLAAKVRLALNPQRSVPEKQPVTSVKKTPKAGRHKPGEPTAPK
jgi:hypothetical protein